MAAGNGFAVDCDLTLAKRNYMKTTLTLLCMACLIVPLTGCGKAQQTDYDTSAYDEQVKVFWEQSAETEKQQKIAFEQLKVSEEQAKRLEKLLDIWDKQAARQDKILDAMEKQYDVHK